MNAATQELTPARLGEQAAQAVRALNHLTRPGIGALTDPAELCDLIAELALLAGRLPQLLGQLAGWLTSEDRAGRLRVDACCPPGGATREAVTEATTALAQAGRCAHASGRALDAAHQALSHLTTAPGSEQEAQP